MSWYLLVWRRFSEFEGRSRRKEFWMFMLVHCLIYSVIGVSLGLTPIFGTGEGENWLVALILVGCLYFLASGIPILALVSRRLQDTGRSPWWWLVSFVPIIGILILLLFMAIQGDLETNEYGPNPKLTQESEASF